MNRTGRGPEDGWPLTARQEGDLDEIERALGDVSKALRQVIREERPCRRCGHTARLHGTPGGKLNCTECGTLICPYYHRTKNRVLEWLRSLLH